eukprot:c31645_g1_i1 orf=57-326(+)
MNDATCIVFHFVQPSTFDVFILQGEINKMLQIVILSQCCYILLHCIVPMDTILCMFEYLRLNDGNKIFHEGVMLLEKVEGIYEAIKWEL